MNNMAIRQNMMSSEVLCFAAGEMYFPGSATHAPQRNEGPSRPPPPQVLHMHTAPNPSFNPPTHMMRVHPVQRLPPSSSFMPFSAPLYPYQIYSRTQPVMTNRAPPPRADLYDDRGNGGILALNPTCSYPTTALSSNHAPAMPWSLNPTTVPQHVLSPWSTFTRNSNFVPFDTRF
jgi:hypothetical protein